MITVYIKKWKNEYEYEFKYKLPKWFNKITKNIIMKFIKKFNIVLIKRIEDNKKLYLVPNINDEKVYLKINKMLSKEETSTQKVQVVLSNEIKGYKDMFKNYRVITGKKVLQEMIEKILEKILENNRLELQDIYILSNNYSEYATSLIKRISSRVKSINIVTKEIKRFSLLEELLYENGVGISISNNKKKSLKKANIIINIDFDEDELTKYVINRKSIIINMTDKKLLNLKSFDGIIVNDIELKKEHDEIDETEEIDFIRNTELDLEFRRIDLYESIKDKIDINKIKIYNLYGNNGKINEKELINMQKILTN